MKSAASSPDETAVEVARNALSVARRRYIAQAVGNPDERALHGAVMDALRAYEAAKDAAWRAANQPKRSFLGRV